MNYRHAYHAGNFADVLKHAALISILEHLRKKDTPFAVIDTHAGRGLYDLQGVEATKTGEAAEGYLRLVSERENGETLPAALKSYADCIKSFGNAYPGSPAIAAHFLRPQDRLIAIEKHPDDVDALYVALGRAPNLRVMEGDGYRELVGFVPPQERRGLVLVDPPFEQTSEWQDAGVALARAYRRFANGIYVLWYPVKLRADVNAGIGELLNAGVTKLLQIELDVGTGNDPRPRAEGQGPRLSASGLLVVNAPFGFAAAMEETTNYLARILTRGADAKATIKRIVGDA